MAKKIISGKARAQGITFTAQVWKEGKAYVAYSPELDVSSCGDTATQAKSRLREAVSLFLEEAAHLGTLRAISPSLASSNAQRLKSPPNPLCPL